MNDTAWHVRQTAVSGDNSTLTVTVYGERKPMATVFKPGDVLEKGRTRYVLIGPYDQPHMWSAHSFRRSLLGKAWCETTRWVGVEGAGSKKWDRAEPAMIPCLIFPHILIRDGYTRIPAPEVSQ